MKKLWFFILILIIFLFSSLNLVYAEGKNQMIDQVEAKHLDKEAAILAEYLAKQDSPLQYHAQDFVDAAKNYNLDWRLVAAISGVESTFGKQIPGGYNGWGWGVYGNQAIYFNSWTEAIFTISKGLRENYLDKGLTDPYSINRTYAQSPNWGSKVTYFMQDLESFASQFVSEKKNTSIMQSDPQIAAVSALPVIR